MSKFSKILGMLVVFTLLLTACGGGQQTQAPTEVMTEAPTEAMTEAPTEAPTEAMTEAPTEAPVAGEIDCQGMLAAARGEVPEHVVNKEVLERPGFQAKLARWQPAP